jgi:hypothetical protein
MFSQYLYKVGIMHTTKGEYRTRNAEDGTRASRPHAGQRPALHESFIYQ